MVYKGEKLHLRDLYNLPDWTSWIFVFVDSKPGTLLDFCEKPTVNSGVLCCSPCCKICISPMHTVFSTLNITHFIHYLYHFWLVFIVMMLHFLSQWSFKELWKLWKWENYILGSDKWGWQGCSGYRNKDAMGHFAGTKLKGSWWKRTEW